MKAASTNARSFCYLWSATVD